VPEVPRAGGRYTLSGDKALWPVEMSDDGGFTRIRWREGAVQPAIYRDDEAGPAAERRDARWRLCGGRRLCAAAVCGGKARARARRQGEARP
jgi:hypothetical protein